eukprot:COSAG06_NODE_1507_length_9245_cov_17.379073_4_plen_95_part_00
MLSGSLSSTILPGLGRAFGLLNAEVTALSALLNSLNSDWRKIGEQCKSMMTKILEAYLTDRIDLNLMEKNQVDAFRAGLYTWGELREKVEQGFA